MIDMFWQKIHQQLQESNRSNTYITFKEDHTREDYLHIIQANKFKKALSRFRLGITEIRGNNRFNKPDTTQKCPFCRANEDEIHVLFHCPTYQELRTKFIHRHWVNTNNLTLKDTLGSKEPKIIIGLAMFIHYAIEKRNALI